MKKWLTNNLFLKIISVAIALLIWFVVENTNDPTVVVSYTVPVTIQNSAYLESDGMTYTVSEESQTATVILRGKKSQVSQRGDDITAVADLTQIVDLDSTPVMVPLTVTCPGISAENITTTPSAISISIEDMVSKDFTISVTSGDSSPEKGYEIGSMDSDPEKVTVTGPQSLISKIDRVVAQVDTSGMSEDTVRSTRLKLYDKNQDELTDTQLGYLKFNIGNPVVDVSIDIWQVRENVSLNVSYTGQPKDGYVVDSITVTPDTISVAGSDEGLQNLTANGNTIQLPADAVNIDGMDADYEVKLNLEDYISSDLKLVNDSQTVIATVSIIPSGSRQIEMSTKSINVENLGEGLRVVYDTDKITLKVYAKDGYDIDNLADADVTASIDVNNKKEGDYQVTLSVNLPEGYGLLETPQADVHIYQLQ